MSQLLDPERKLSYYFQELLNTYTESIQDRLRSAQAKAQESLEELERQTAGIAPQITGEEIAAYVKTTLGELRAEHQATMAWHSRLLTAVEGITRSTEQREILGAVLDAAAQISERVFILLVRRGQVSGWDGRGYEADFVASGLKEFATSAVADAAVGPLLEENRGRTYSRLELPPGAQYLEIPGFDKPEKFHAFPLALFGSVAAVLIVDGEGCRVADNEALQSGQMVVTAAAVWLENLAMRKSLGLGLFGAAPVAEPVAAAPESAIEEPPTAKAAPAVPDLVWEPVEEPAEAPVREEWETPEVLAPPAEEEFVIEEIPGAPDKSAAVTKEFPADEPAVDLEMPGLTAGAEEFEIRLEEPPVAPAVGDEPAVEEIFKVESLGEEEFVVDSAAPPAEIPAMFEQEPEEIVLEESPEMGYSPAAGLPTAPAGAVTDEPEEIVLEERPLEELILEESTPVSDFAVPPPAPPAPPAPATPVSAQPWTTSEQEKQYNDARRFARLLVSEIKLYNEDAVTEGRIERDLYRRLQKDIDRSREMFAKRVSRSLGLKIDYFHEELVRILAEGDPNKLGQGYPGPVL
jgi:hypothetical protein